jgi:hypothetical protein
MLKFYILKFINYVLLNTLLLLNIYVIFFIDTSITMLLFSNATFKIVVFKFCYFKYCPVHYYHLKK